MGETGSILATQYVVHIVYTEQSRLKLMVVESKSSEKIHILNNIRDI